MHYHDSVSMASPITAITAVARLTSRSYCRAGYQLCSLDTNNAQPPLTSERHLPAFVIWPYDAVGVPSPRDMTAAGARRAGWAMPQERGGATPGSRAPGAAR